MLKTIRFKDIEVHVHKCLISYGSPSEGSDSLRRKWMGRRNQGDKEQAQHLNQSAVVHFLNKNEEATATYFVAVSLHHYQDKRDRDVLYNSDVILCWYQDKEMPELDVGVLSLIADIRWSDIAQDYEV